MNGRVSPGFSGALLPLVLIAAFSGIASAEQANERQECGAQAQPFLTERLTVWQQRLKLDKWNISIVMAHPSELKPKTLGNIHWDADKKIAVIRVLDASDYQMSCPDTIDDMEFTVVHELVHLELSSLPRSEASRRDEEFAVNQLADALLKLDRRR